MTAIGATMAYATQNLSIKRDFNHKGKDGIGALGFIGSCVFKIDNGVWTINGREVKPAGREYLMDFSLQCLQDSYAGAVKNGWSREKAQEVWNAKLESIYDGSAGQRGGGGGVSLETKAQRIVAFKAYVNTFGAGSDKVKDLEGSGKGAAKRKNAALDQLWAKNGAKPKWKDAFETELATLKAQRAAVDLTVEDEDDMEFDESEGEEGDEEEEGEAA